MNGYVSNDEIDYKKVYGGYKFGKRKKARDRVLFFRKREDILLSLLHNLYK